jgi:hypothetical protein
VFVLMGVSKNFSASMFSMFPSYKGHFKLEPETVQVRIHFTLNENENDFKVRKAKGLMGLKVHHAYAKYQTLKA